MLTYYRVKVQIPGLEKPCWFYAERNRITGFQRADLKETSSLGFLGGSEGTILLDPDPKNKGVVIATITPSAPLVRSLGLEGKVQLPLRLVVQEQEEVNSNSTYRRIKEYGGSD
ncbi:hypothetical protein HYS48_04910 [Candidatus Woesearchaeota archaeon]|nr:hypothetical protein [Candidatus Woesearchaeota archaeon]